MQKAQGTIEDGDFLPFSAFLVWIGAIFSSLAI